MREILEAALDAAVAAGAAYADVRGVETATESLAVRGQILESADRSDSAGFGVRVLKGGGWGYAASATLTKAEARRLATLAVEIAEASASRQIRPVELVPEPAHRSSWSTPVAIDPWTVSLEDKVGLLMAVTTEMERVKGITVARGTMDFTRHRTLLATSEGSLIEQSILHSGSGIEATALTDGEVQQRSYPGSFRGDLGAGGYELIEAVDLPANAIRTAEEAAALLRAPVCPQGIKTLVIDGHQVMLQVHESVGHATELDRVLGMEASFAGTSFVSTEDVGRLRFGSDLVNITADATAPGGLGTFAFDDEGVVAQKTHLIRDGMLVGLQTSRDTAGALNQDRSNGAMRADGWENFPIIRMTNINLLPGEGSLDDLFADVDDGIYMSTNKSWSIDDKRKNFQFGCEIAWEIENGRLGRMLKDPRYTGITTQFWTSCDAIAGPEEWRMRGTPNCGKGQPGQTMRVGHGTAPARFRDVAVGVDS
jgi:TldD protein